MQIIETKVEVSDLCKNYSDNGDGGIVGVSITFFWISIILKGLRLLELAEVWQIQ